MTRSDQLSRPVVFGTGPLQSIVDVSDDAIISIDTEQNIILFNQGAEKIFGYKASEIIEKPLDLLIPLAAKPNHREHVKSFSDSPVQARRMAERATIKGRRKSGEEFPAEATISKVIADGQMIFTVILRDITERKKAEESLEHYARELARSNLELEQFTYVASHDLQEPLRMISNFCQLLKDDYQDKKLDEAGFDYIDFAIDGAKRMRVLIEDLLRFSRLQRTDKPKKRVDVSAILKVVLGDLKMLIDEKGAVVNVEPLPKLIGDDVQLSQLFQNLVSNSLKFCDSSPVVNLRCKELESEWLFSVEDNGIGIDPKYFDKIFLIFQRLHSNDKYPGTGIGLALCRKIVEQHRGRIWLESEPGQGTKIFFTVSKALESK